jgi:peroxiredoxin
MPQTLPRTLLAFALALSPLLTHAQETQEKPPAHTPTEQTIVDLIETLRATPDAERGAKTTGLATQIKALPASSPNKLRLADTLAHLSTEGDLGHATVQAVADTLTSTLNEYPQPPGKDGAPASPYIELARLARYEHVTTTMTNPQYTQAIAGLAAIETDIQKADFTLTDLEGRSWTLSQLRGKVVLVNFWATSCLPCRKELPNLDALAKRFASQDLIVLSITDENIAKVTAYILGHGVDYPILIDTDRKAREAFHIEGIPQSFVFNREGKLVAQSIDMRTQNQFLQMLAAADIK